MATSPREATKAVSRQIMKMYCLPANLLVLFNGNVWLANKSPRCRPLDTDLETPAPQQASAKVLKTLIMPQNPASTHTSPHTLYTFVIVTPGCEHLLPIYAKHHNAEGGRSSFCLCAASAEGHDQETAAGAQGRIQGGQLD